MILKQEMMHSILQVDFKFQSSWSLTAIYCIWPDRSFLLHEALSLSPGARQRRRVATFGERPSMNFYYSEKVLFEKRSLDVDISSQTLCKLDVKKESMGFLKTGIAVFRNANR